MLFRKEKSGQLRLIVDGRIGNQILVPPEPVDLCTSSSFAKLRVDNCETLYCSALDVENAFYNFEIPAWLSACYGLEPLTAGEAQLDSLEGCPLSDNDLVILASMLYRWDVRGQFIGARTHIPRSWRMQGF